VTNHSQDAEEHRQRECVAAEPADTIKDNGVLGVDLVVDAMVDHLQDAVPFERMERNARAEGVPLAANTLASSVHALIDRCQPIVEHIFQRCVSSQVVGADATTMPVLDPKVPRGIRRMALWNLLGDNRFSYFGAAQSGHGDKLKELLQGCTLGVLQCDGSATLNKIAAVSEERAGCHSHARCKFVEALKSGDARAIPALLKYTELFAAEAESKALRESHDERLLRRITQSRKLITELWDRVDELRPNVEPRSKLGQALTYMVNQRATLEIFLSDGRVAMTNNAVERASDVRVGPQDVDVLRQQGERRADRCRANDRADVPTARRGPAGVSEGRRSAPARRGEGPREAVARELRGRVRGDEGDGSGCIAVERAAEN
jgi:hypothetical protein